MKYYCACFNFIIFFGFKGRTKFRILENNSEIIIERIATLYGFKSIAKIIIKQEPRSIGNDLPDKKITDKDTEKMVNSTLQNIENKELEATLKKLAEDIFGK